MTNLFHEIEAYDISLLTLLSNGYILEEISRGSKNRVYLMAAAASAH
jgi:hypothetical protein